MAFVMTFHEFNELHGNDALVVENRYLYGDGASCDRDCRWLNDPPTDEIQRLKLRRNYVKQKLDNHLEAARRFQQDCMEMAHLSTSSQSPVPPPPADAPARLKRAQADANKLCAELTEIEVKLRNSSAGVTQQQRQQAEAEHRDRISKLADEIISVQL